jgi:hypothetical protein
MTVIDKKDCRKAEIILNEIRAMQNLIDRRWIWLNKPENKARRTYQAILKDTKEMEGKLKDLRNELENAELITQQ